MVLSLLLACSGEPPPDASSPDPTTPPTETPSTTGHTGTPPAPTADTAPPPLDCDALPAPPLPITRLTGPPADEDFAFDDQGKLISYDGYSLLMKSDHPPGDVTPWTPTQGSGATASMRMLSTGDLVYHELTTLFLVAPSGGTEVLFSGFGYAGGIEIHPTDLIYVVDLMGLHLVDPNALTHELILRNAPWFSPNGITLSEDYDTLYVSAHDGIWSMPVDASGQPTSAPTLWADPPANARELLGMGVDACGNVYVVGATLNSVSTLWRYRQAGGAPEVLLERPGGWLSNLQWGSGLGGWDDHVLYVVDRNRDDAGYDAVEVGVPEKPR